MKKDLCFVIAIFALFACFPFQSCAGSHSHAMIFLGIISYERSDNHFYVANDSMEQGQFSTKANKWIDQDGKPTIGPYAWDFGIVTGKTRITVNHLIVRDNILRKINGKRTAAYGKFHIANNGERYCDELFVLLPDDNTPK